MPNNATPVLTPEHITALTSFSPSNIDRQTVAQTLIDLFASHQMNTLTQAAANSWAATQNRRHDALAAAVNADNDVDDSTRWPNSASSRGAFETSLTRGSMTGFDRRQQYEFVRDRNILEQYLVNNMDTVLETLLGGTPRTRHTISAPYRTRTIDVTVERRQINGMTAIPAQRVLDTLRDTLPNLRFSRSGEMLNIAAQYSDLVWGEMTPLQKIKEIATYLEFKVLLDASSYFGRRRSGLRTEEETRYINERVNDYIRARNTQRPGISDPTRITRPSRSNVMREVYLFAGSPGSYTAGVSNLDTLRDYILRSDSMTRAEVLRTARGIVVGTGVTLPAAQPSQAELQRRQERFTAFMQSKVNKHKQKAEPQTRGGIGTANFRRQAIEQFNAIPLLDHGTLSSRTWGIEIEVVAASYIAAAGGTPLGWDRKGDGSLQSAEGYDDSVFDADGYCREHDEAECDTCFGGNGDSGFRGAQEFVSPILKSFHSRGVDHITRALQDAPSNSTPGVHVHVGADDLTGKQVANIVSAWALIEPLMDPIYQREARSYCRTTEVSHAATLASHIDKQATTSTDSGRRSIASVWGERYRTINLLALSSHTTIEFRAMGPVYDYEYLIRWAWFVREFVNVASVLPLDRFAKVESVTDVVNLLIEYGHEHVGSSKISKFQAEVEAMTERQRTDSLIGA